MEAFRGKKKKAQMQKKHSERSQLLIAVLPNQNTQELFSFSL